MLSMSCRIARESYFQNIKIDFITLSWCRAGTGSTRARCCSAVKVLFAAEVGAYAGKVEWPEGGSGARKTGTAHPRLPRLPLQSQVLTQSSGWSRINHPHEFLRRRSDRHEPHAPVLEQAVRAA